MKLLHGDYGVIAQKLVLATKVICQEELETEQRKVASKCLKKDYVKGKCQFVPLVSASFIVLSGIYKML